jgi:AbrB family looped-hinge helix DNA binding protein
MAEATLSSKNQIVIPREAREAFELKPGDKLLIRPFGHKVLVLERPKSYRRAILGRGGRYPKNYLKKERQGWK